jgi:hypothetical protein
VQGDAAQDRKQRRVAGHLETELHGLLQRNRCETGHRADAYPVTGGPGVCSEPLPDCGDEGDKACAGRQKKEQTASETKARNGGNAAASFAINPGRL